MTTINNTVGKRTLSTRLKTVWMWIEYYCYGKWVGGYFHPSSLEIVEIEINAAKDGILNTSWPQQKGSE